MDYQTLFEQLNVLNNLLALLLGMPRFFMIMQVAPFMAGTILTGQLRTTIVFACYMMIHPAVVASLPDSSGSLFLSIAYCGTLIAKEAFIGMCIGYLAGIIFWTVQSAGFFIDNQRGASMASESDPLSGEQTSPLGSFFFQSTVYLFFSSGAFMVFLATIYASYEVWPVTAMLPLEAFRSLDIPLFFAGRVSWLMLAMLLLSGPIVVACLLTDVSLGLINRFASQLNVYVLAMPIKSGVAMFLLIFYFALLMKNAVSLFGDFEVNLELFRRYLPLVQP